MEKGRTEIAEMILARLAPDLDINTLFDEGEVGALIARGGPLVGALVGRGLRAPQDRVQ